MKTAFSLLALISTIGFAHAGGFGGPPPFTGGSPLPTGVDGVYQAVASATNVTGLFTFSIVGGIQSNTPSANRWVFFVDGEVLSGNVSANISNDKVVGILDSGLNGLKGDDSGQITLPMVVFVPGNAASGTFNGTIDLNSPIAAFEGEGVLSGTPARTDQIIFISEGSDVLPPSVLVTPVVIPGSTFDVTKFDFRGTRLTTTGK